MGFFSCQTAVVLAEGISEMTTNSNQAIDALNRLHAIHCQSLPVYLAGTSPWYGPGSENARTAVDQIIRDQKEMAARIGTRILEMGTTPYRGVPEDFTWLNDLSLEFLVGRLLQHQQQDVEKIEEITTEIGHHDVMAKALADEALGMAKGHLQSLTEMVGQTTSDGG